MKSPTKPGQDSSLPVTYVTNLTKTKNTIKKFRSSSYVRNIEINFNSLKLHWTGVNNADLFSVHYKLAKKPINSVCLPLGKTVIVCIWSIADGKLS